MNRGEGEEQLVAFKLYLGLDATNVSQPIAMGGYNQVMLHVWIESSSTAIATNAVVVKVQSSPDLDTWTDVSGLSVTLTKAPNSGVDATTGGTDQVPAPYIRLFYDGGAAVLLGASVRLFHT